LEPTSPSPKADDENQFERAVTYIGESGAVKMAILVDEEGLPLACFNRCNEDSELWAPLANVLEGNNRMLLNHYNRGGAPEKIDISTGKFRIILRRIEHVTLMTLAEHNADETILIRIAQAADMVRKYMSERYSPAMFARVEERYVSNS
jgi:predicted regulator of Ras-like GTPase activity (Roadblock/LC7/MglB family)